MVSASFAWQDQGNLQHSQPPVVSALFDNCDKEELRFFPPLDGVFLSAQPIVLFYQVLCGIIEEGEGIQ